MREIIDFMMLLAENNNKPWFDAHRTEYLQVRKRMEAFAMDFLHGIEGIDTRIHDLQLRDITYRINRDIRFSNDKSPYKTWLGVFVCPKGKKSGMAGYYVHLEPATDTYFICSGLYCPTKEILASVREEIMLEPERFHDTVMACGEDFPIDWEGALRRMPKGFSENDTHSEYYRLKNYNVVKRLTRKDVEKPDFLKSAIRDLGRTHGFTELLNRCVDYANGL